MIHSFHYLDQFDFHRIVHLCEAHERIVKQMRVLVPNALRADRCDVCVRNARLRFSVEKGVQRATR